MRVIVCLLAGGASSRFPGGKVNVRVNGAPLLSFLRTQLQGLEPDQWWLSLAPQQDLPPGADGFDLVVRDEQTHAGPLHGIMAALRSAEPEDHLVIVPADMLCLTPAIPEVLLNGLAIGPEQAGMMAKWGLGPRAGEIEPMPCVWRTRQALPVLERALAAGRGGPRQLAGEPGIGKVFLYDEEEAVQFTSFNTPTELHRMAKALGCTVTLPAK